MPATMLLHQWKKELRGLRPVLWIWVPLLALHALCVVHGLDWNESLGRHSPLRGLVLSTSGWFVLLPAMVFGLWPLRNDLPLDPDAFWRTKPVPGVAVAAAKVLALLTVFLLPAFAVDAGLVLRVGGASALDGLLLENGLVRLGMILAILALTALAGGAFRMGLVTAAGAAILAFGVGGILALVPPDRLHYTPTLIASRFLVAGGCKVAGSLLVLYALYHLGHARMAGSCGITTALTVVLVFILWPIDFYRLAPALTVAPLGEEPRISMTPLSVETSPYNPKHPHSLLLQLQLAPLSRLLSVRLHEAWVDIRDPAGRPTAAGWADLRSMDDPNAAGSSLDTMDRAAFLHRLGAKDLAGAIQQPFSYTARLRTPFDRLIPGAYSVDANLTFYDFRQAGTMPLAVGSRLRFGGNSIEITSLGWNPGNGGQVVAEIREDVLQCPFDVNGPTAALPSQAGPASLFGYAILNDAGDVVLAIPNPQGSQLLPPGRNEDSLLLMFHRNRSWLALPPRLGDPHGMELIETYRGRTLVVMQRVYGGSVIRRADVAWEGE